MGFFEVNRDTLFTVRSTFEIQYALRGRTETHPARNLGARDLGIVKNVCGDMGEGGLSVLEHNGGNAF